MTASNIGVTEGNGKKVATSAFEEGGVEVHAQRMVVNGPDGTDMRGQKARAGSLATTMAFEDVDKLSEANPGIGVVAIPSGAAAPLTTPTRGIHALASGNLVATFANGADNAALPLPLIAGQVYPYRITKLMPSNGVAVAGIL